METPAPPPHHQDSARWGLWLAAAQDGDGDAYARLLAELNPVARRLAGKHWGGEADLEDVVQDILLTLHAARHTYDPSRPFLPWFAAIAEHRIKDALRRRRRHRGREVDIGEFIETFPARPANTETTDHADLRKAVARLPPGQRQAVELLKLKEMSLAEASDASGQSVSALKVAMHRALKALKGMMRP